MALAVYPATHTGYIQLIPPATCDRLIGRIVKDHELSEDEAREILDATAGFLRLCADHPTHGFAPSRQVDIGWHTFLLYTRAYSAFCQSLAGHFIHHEPNDLPGQRASKGSRATVAFMQEHDIPFNPAMWVVSQRECGDDIGCGSNE